MSLNNIVVGNFGQDIELTILDVDTNAAADVSAYVTSQIFEIRDPGGVVETKVAAFKAGGADGVVVYTLADGDIDETGLWSIRAYVTLVGLTPAVLYSEWLDFNVDE